MQRIIRTIISLHLTLYGILISIVAINFLLIAITSRDINKNNRIKTCVISAVLTTGISVAIYFTAKELLSMA